jgi:hypothetical protein
VPRTARGSWRYTAASARGKRSAGNANNEYSRSRRRVGPGYRNATSVGASSADWRTWPGVKASPVVPRL